MTIRLFTIFITLLLPIMAIGQNNNPYSTTLPQIPAKDVGIYIEDLRTGDVILDVNGEKLFTPASVTKLVTTSTALNKLNPTGKFTTDIEAVGTIKDGVLDGNLVVRACGDPTIESAHFPSNKGFADKVALAVEKAGIRKITGTVVAKYQADYEQPTPKGWMDEDLIHPYGTEFHAVNYADNVVNITMPSGKTTPETPGLVAKRTGHTRRQRGSTIIETSSSIRAANPMPESALCQAIVNALKSHKIEVGTTEVKASTSSTRIYTHTSPTFTEIITSLMYRSDNLMAEGMLRSTAPGRPRKEAIDNELKFWSDKGVDVTGIVIEDGSGLSRNNKITPYFLA